MLRTQLDNIFGDYWQFDPATLPNPTNFIKVSRELPVLNPAMRSIINTVNSETKKLPAEYLKEFFAKLDATAAINSAVNAVVKQMCQIKSRFLQLTYR